MTAFVMAFVRMRVTMLIGAATIPCGRARIMVITLRLLLAG